MEFTITKEQIDRLSKMAEYGSTNVIKADLKNWFPEAFKTELEVGKWYRNANKALANFQGGTNGYGFTIEGEWNLFQDNWSFDFPENWIPATDKEVEEALIAEAKKRGYKKGVKLSALKYCCNEIDNRLEFYKYFPSVSKDIGHRLELNGTGIYQDGAWAEILPKEKTTISKEKALKIIAEKLKVSPENIEIK